MIKIKQHQYNELKELFYSDSEAIKYPFPIVVISPNSDETLNVYMQCNPSIYLYEKCPWLLDVLKEDILTGKQHRNEK